MKEKLMGEKLTQEEVNSFNLILGTHFTVDTLTDTEFMRIKIAMTKWVIDFLNDDINVEKIPT